MTTTLTSAANSEYVANLSHFRTSGQLPEVIVYVENWIDVSFWNECFRSYSGNFRFTIQPYRLPDNKKAGCKKMLLDAFEDSVLGQNLMLAVDADYDWIIDNYRPSPTTPSVSARILGNPYILHTYLYSVENYKCHADCLSGIITKATGATPPIDCKRHQESYSQAVAPLFLIHLVSADLVDGTYPIASFISDVDKINLDTTTMCLTEKSRKFLSRRLEQLNDYQEAHSGEIHAFEVKLHDLGFSAATYYLLFKGHCVANTMARNKLQKHVKRLRRLKIDEINSNPDTQQAHQDLINYCNVTGISDRNNNEEINQRLEQLICDCTEIHKAREGYDRLKQDIDNLFRHTP